MAKAKLKVVEPSLQDQLETAIAQEAALREDLKRADAAFKAKYPGDVRLRGAGLTRFEEQDVLASHEQEDKRRERRKAEFTEAWNSLCDLRKSADMAARQVRHLETTIAERVDEASARSELSSVLADIKSTNCEITQLAKSVEELRGLVRRAREKAAEADAKLTQASHAVDAALAAGLGDYLDASVQTTDALKVARAGRLEAADEAEMARKAVAIAEARLTAEEQKLQNANTDLLNLDARARELAASIATTSIPRLLEEAKAVQLELEHRRTVLKFLAEFASTELNSQVYDYLTDEVFTYERLGGLIDDHPAVAPWHAAIETLARDANADLPKIREC